MHRLVHAAMVTAEPAISVHDVLMKPRGEFIGMLQVRKLREVARWWRFNGPE